MLTARIRPVIGFLSVLAFFVAVLVFSELDLASGYGIRNEGPGAYPQTVGEIHHQDQDGGSSAGVVLQEGEE